MNCLHRKISLFAAIASIYGILLLIIGELTLARPLTFMLSVKVVGMTGWYFLVVTNIIRIFLISVSNYYPGP